MIWCVSSLCHVIPDAYQSDDVRVARIRIAIKVGRDVLDVFFIMAGSLPGQTVREWRLLNRSQKTASLLAFLAGEVQFLKQQMQTAAGEYDMEELAMLITDIALERIHVILATEHSVKHTRRERSLTVSTWWMDVLVGELSRNDSCLGS